MRSPASAVPFLPALLVCAACAGDGGGGPKEVAFGLDERPSNEDCLAKPRPPSGYDVDLAPAFSPLSFTDPVFLVPHPTVPDRWYVVEQGGTIRVFDDGDTASTVAFSQSTNNPPPYEGGLLGFAFHPDFESNGRAFVSYTQGSSPFTSHIREVTSADGGLTFTAPAPPFLSVSQPYGNHNGGMIAFGPDGYLYIGFGDGGSGNDPGNVAQNPSSLLGKILRIDVDPSSASYGIPPDNPFAGDLVAEEEIYAWGFRNPWRFSFDQGSDALWVGDVGQDAWEEIDLVERGGNYGWKVMEGDHCRPPTTGCSTAGLEAPIVEHPHDDYNSITAGYVYRGSALPTLVGVFLYADFTTGQIHGVFEDEASGVPIPLLVADASFRVSSFGQGTDGEVYVLDYDGGTVRKLVAGTGGPPPSEFPQLLSQTGCFDPNDARQPAEGLIPYEVNAPLWSDGAEKRRWMALPDGEVIEVDEETGDWELPVGTVLVKEFSLDGERLETRLLMRHTDGNWAGYTYEWNQAGTDAELLPAGKTRDVGGGQVWGFPSRAECLKCHTAAAGRTLGLETAQLNRRALYPGDKLADQLDTLAHIGMFDEVPVRLDPLPEFDDNASSIEARARAYLHVNCSHCHRPGSTGQGTADLRFQTSFEDMALCDAPPQEGNLGVAGAALLVPGEPDLSVVSLRMKALDSTRMPDVASRVVDPVGTQLVDGWIEGIAACP